jgi:hypothetical protein
MIDLEHPERVHGDVVENARILARAPVRFGAR